LFQSITAGRRRGLWNHAAFVYLVGDGLGRLLRYRSYQPGSAPKLHTMALRNNLGLRNGRFIVGAHQRLVPIEVTVIAHSVGAYSGITAELAGREMSAIRLRVQPSPPGGLGG
jgi:hypothetical protein